MVYVNENRFIQFELWKACSIGCKFCCNKGQKDIDKKESLNFVLNILNSDEINIYNEVGFIGGEFFNGEIENNEIKTLFYNIFNKVSNLSFTKIYIATSLIFNINDALIPFLEYLKTLGILDKIVLCTSFDVKYRFSNLDKKALWESNMLILKEKYPEIGLHTEIILTEWFLQSVLTNKFNLISFKRVFNTTVDYIEPSSGLYYKDKKDCEKACPGFFPKLKTFIEFIKYSIKNGLIDIDTFLSMELRSNTLYFLENGIYRKAENRRQGDGRCELIDKSKRYEIGFIDSDKTMYNVSRNLFEMLKD